MAAKLSLAETKLKSAERKPGGKLPILAKGKFLFVRGALDDTIRDLKEWQVTFDPTWYLTMRIGQSAINRELKTVRQELKEADKASLASFQTTVRLVDRSPLELADGLREAIREDTKGIPAVFLPHEALDRVEIAFSAAKVARRVKVTQSKLKWMISETHTYVPAKHGT